MRFPLWRFDIFFRASLAFTLSSARMKTLHWRERFAVLTAIITCSSNSISLPTMCTPSGMPPIARRSTKEMASPGQINVTIHPGEGGRGKRVYRVTVRNWIVCARVWSFVNKLYGAYWVLQRKRAWAPRNYSVLAAAPLMNRWKWCWMLSISDNTLTTTNRSLMSVCLARSSNSLSVKPRATTPSWALRHLKGKTCTN